MPADGLAEQPVAEDMIGLAPSSRWWTDCPRELRHETEEGDEGALFPNRRGRVGVARDQGDGVSLRRTEKLAPADVTSRPQQDRHEGPRGRNLELGAEELRQPWATTERAGDPEPRSRLPSLDVVLGDEGLKVFAGQVVQQGRRRLAVLG